MSQEEGRSWQTSGNRSWQRGGNWPWQNNGNWVATDLTKAFLMTSAHLVVAAGRLFSQPVLKLVLSLFFLDVDWRPNGIKVAPVVSQTLTIGRPLTWVHGLTHSSGNWRLKTNHKNCHQVTPTNVSTFHHGQAGQMPFGINSSTNHNTLHWAATLQSRSNSLTCPDISSEYLRSIDPCNSSGTKRNACYFPLHYSYMLS